MLRSHAPRVAEVILGGALAGVAFGAAGGSELARTTVVEVLMVLLRRLVAVAILWARRGPLTAPPALLLSPPRGVTALSVTWAVVPRSPTSRPGARSPTWLFAAAVAGARLAPRATRGGDQRHRARRDRPPVLYALAARVWPGSLGETEISNRIGQPFQYWNAVGTTAALAVPGLLWLGARREAAAWSAGPRLSRRSARRSSRSC